MSCAVCGQGTPTNLCDECASELDTPLPFVAEQILSAAARPEQALLVDVWGRVHPIERSTRIGRTPQSRGVALLHASVSRDHAELTLVDGTWWLSDLGSSNGTRCNDDSITKIALARGDRLSFGSVGMYFVLDDGKRVSLDATQLASRTLRPEEGMRSMRPVEPSEPTHSGLPRFPMRLVEAPAGGGYLEAGGSTVKLSITQYAMMAALTSRMCEEASLSTLVRGFVTTGQLIADLPWEAVAPDENHLKQLVRRTRRVLDAVRLGGLIESRRGFGYRLRVMPVTDATT